MAMGFREPNMARWIGFRPGHNGTQVIKYQTATNGNAIVHTVTAGKVFYLTYWSIFVGNNATAGANLFVRDAADAFVCYLATLLNLVNVQPHAIVGNFWPPYEVPAGYDVVLQSTAAGFAVYSTIHGWEE